MFEFAWISAQTEVIGYLAASLVVMTFVMRSILWLRIFAVASNCAFLVYSSMAGLGPIFALHAVLLPINLFRIWELFICARKAHETSLK